MRLPSTLNGLSNGISKRLCGSQIKRKTYISDEAARVRPRNQGPDGPNAEKPSKIDLSFEEAVRRAMRTGQAHRAADAP